jgi:hypothetical protein
MHGRPASFQALQIIVIGLFLGMASMSGVAIMVQGTAGMGGAKPPGTALTPEVFAGILGALALTSAMMLLVIPPMMIKQALPRYRAQETEEGKREVAMQTLSTTTITKCALVEGVGLFGVVTFFLTGTWLLLAAPFLAGLLLLWFFPTDGKLQRVRERLEMARA